MSLCLFELDALGLGRSRVGRLGRLRSPHAPQSSNLSRVCGSLNSTFDAPGRGALDILFRRPILRHSDTSMADARRARAKRRAAVAACVAQTAPAGDGCARRAPSPVANAATGPAGHEQQASSMHSMWRDGRTSTPQLTPAGSSSHTHRGLANAQAALLMARELLRYRPVTTSTRTG